MSDGVMRFSEAQVKHGIVSSLQQTGILNSGDRGAANAKMVSVVSVHVTLGIMKEIWTSFENTMVLSGCAVS